MATAAGTRGARGGAGISTRAATPSPSGAMNIRILSASASAEAVPQLDSKRVAAPTEDNTRMLLNVLRLTFIICCLRYFRQFSFFFVERFLVYRFFSFP